MNFIDQHHQLCMLYTSALKEIPIPGSPLTIMNHDFQSQGYTRLPLGYPEVLIPENFAFTYPVIATGKTKKWNRMILLLHGLNERSWNKHLMIARYLVESTGNPVILFPLSYHMNRGLPEWSDTRKMAKQLETRKLRYPHVREASLANLALSERLTDHPERFFSAGYQSAMDITLLLQQIQAGRHPLFNAGTQTDVFAYSISCMVVQALMLCNPGRILDKARIVLFAGGCLFNRMNGISRYIMDNIAFRSIQNHYANRSRKMSAEVSGKEHGIPEQDLARAFYTLTETGNTGETLEKKFLLYKKRLMVIALENDQVIPVKAVAAAFGEKICSSDHFRIVAFPYAYSHENPFPLLNRNISDLVANSFARVFEPVGRFFNDIPQHLYLGRWKVDYETTAGTG